MQKLYLDCDGVILDTINYTYQIIKERGISEDKIDDFYKNLSWETLIEEAGEINNSIEKIKELSDESVQYLKEAFCKVMIAERR